MLAPPSFDALYRGHFGLVWSVVVRAGVAPGSREDAVQEVWLTVHRRLGSYDGSAPAASWIAGIARHVVWRQIRAVIRTRRKLVALDRVAPDGLDDPVLARETMRGIEGVIAGLEPMFREVFVAVEILGATGPEAAAQLGLPLNTLYSRLRLARARVHAGLDALDDEPIAAAPRGLAERTWLALAPSVGIAAATPTTMLSFAGALAAAVVVAVAAIAVGSPADPPPVVIAAAREAEVATPIQPAIASPPAAPLAAITPPLAPAPPEPVAVPRSSGTSRARSPAPPPEQGDDEVALIARATAARHRGDAAAAMAAITEHEQRFPDGSLAVDRKVERVRALCATGKPAQARAEAAALARAHPDRAAVVALGEGCSKSP